MSSELCEGLSIGVHQGCVGISEGDGGYRGMHVVIVGGGVGMAIVGPQDGVNAPHEARYWG
jgi:hypothetical protein